VLISSMRRGGAERVVSLLTQEWAKRHHVLLATFDSGDLAYRFGGHLFDLRAPARPGGVLRKACNFARRVIKLARLFARSNPDMIIGFMESANFPSIIAAVATRRLDRLIVSVHNDADRFPRIYRVLIPTLYRFPHKVVAVSEGVGTKLKELGVPVGRITSIPNPVSPSRTAFGVIEHTATVSGNFVLGVGRLHPQKGFDRLLHAFAALGDEDLQLVILGDGPERATLEALACNLGIRGRVHFPGAVPNPAAWYARASLFVLSSRHEGWPMVLMEAMLFACPVVAFNCRYGPAEILQDGVSGILVPEGDTTRLALAMRRLMNDPALRARIGGAGQERVAHFAADRVSNLWLELR
jgi:glycosyltransferase involved in cell wall biosynthesis